MDQGQAPGQNEPTQQFMLFYSDQCGQSKKFINLLQEFPHINSCFQKLEVEMLAKLGRLPPQLTHTPGVIDGNQLLMGSNAFQWLNDKTKELIGSGPSLNPKGGFNDMGFSFIGNSEHDFSPTHANFGRETENNGNNIDPNKFDPKSGQPQSGQQQQTNMTYNPNINVSSNNNNQQRPLPPQLQSQKIGTNGNDLGINNQQSIPPQLQPQTINKGGSKLTDSEMQNYLANRDNGINIQR